MIRADKVTAIFRLGISADIADLIEGMSKILLYSQNLSHWQHALLPEPKQRRVENDCKRHDG